MPVSCGGLHARLAHGAGQTQDDFLQTGCAATITAYIDDINLMVAHSHIPKAYATIKHNLVKLGLHLNDSKTDCWIHPDTVPYASHFHQILRTTQPMVLKTAAKPVSTFSDNSASVLPQSHQKASEMQKLINKRTSNAIRYRVYNPTGFAITLPKRCGARLVPATQHSELAALA